MHDLPVAHGEDGEELAVQLDAGELLAGRVVDAENDVVAAGDQLQRVHLVRLGGAAAQPGEDLIAPLARDRCGDVFPSDVWVEMLSDRVDIAAPQRVDPVQHELEIGLYGVGAHSSSSGKTTKWGHPS